MATPSYLTPNTDAQWPLTVTDTNNNPVVDAAVVADVFNPAGTKVASGVTMAYSGSAGIYTLNIAAAWSLVAGVPLIGSYKVVYTITRSGTTKVGHYTYIVQFGDEP